MEEVRATRDKKLSNMKRKEIELLEAGKLTGLGFSGAQLTGMSGSNMYEMPRHAASPSSRGGFGGDSAYNTYGGAYQTNYSAFSMDPREERSRKNWRLIA